jgi:predicted amidohydrolase YtcJ
MFADLVLLNGKIVTMDPEENILQAAAVKFGRFLNVGTNEDIQQSIGEETEVIDLEGRTVLPGFIDSHGHLFSSGIGLSYIDCSAEGGVSSIADIKEKISNRVRSTEKGRWIIGIKVDESVLAEKRLPNRQDLDEVAPDHPVFLVYVGAHVYMANSKAFEVRGITRNTPDPVPRGRFDRDPDTGELTGIIYEGAADSIRPEPTVEDTVRGIERICEKYVSAGITCFYDSFVTGKEIKAFQKTLTRGRLPMRVRWDMHLDTLPQLEEMGFQIPPGFGDEWLKIVGVKVTTDGAISGRTAALRSPYLHKPDYYGELMMPREEIIEVMDKIHSKGLRASVHANGDQAIVNFLDAVQIALEKHPRKDHRHRDIHCSVVDAEIIERIKKLGILPTIFGAYPYYHGDKILPAFGEERAEWMFPARSMLDAGIKVAAHSDHSASPYPPLMGIHSLVNRKTKKGRLYGTTQRISIIEALKLYTINAAYQMFDEEILGSIEPGKFADMVVLGRDILTIPSEDIIDVPIDMTIVGGKIVYDSSDTNKVHEKERSWD